MVFKFASLQLFKHGSLYHVWASNPKSHSTRSQFNHIEMNQVVKEGLSEIAHKERPGGDVVEAD